MRRGGAPPPPPPLRCRYALSKQVYYRRDEALADLARLMEDQLRFDTSRLVDLDERALLDCPVVQVRGRARLA